MICPLGKNVHDGCPYCKESLCDYPYIGAKILPMESFRKGDDPNLVERMSRRIN